MTESCSTNKAFLLSSNSSFGGGAGFEEAAANGLAVEALANGLAALFTAAKGDAGVVVDEEEALANGEAEEKEEKLLRGFALAKPLVPLAAAKGDAGTTRPLGAADEVPMLAGAGSSKLLLTAPGEKRLVGADVAGREVDVLAGVGWGAIAPLGIGEAPRSDPTSSSARLDLVS